MLGVAEHAKVAQVHRVVARHGGTPAIRHLGDGFRFAGEAAAQGVFQPAVNNSLAGQCLIAPQGMAFQQQALIAGRIEPVDQPQPGDATTYNQYVGFQGCVAHGPPSLNSAAMLA